jgi:predicted CxxxxCH...CXXCH cytochrome family protein
VAWTPAQFDHRNVVAGTCGTCHNGVSATGKPNNHLPTTQSCDACHVTLAWKPATFSHAGITTGCSSCHNNTVTAGKSTRHMTTSRECVICHSTTAWTPLTFRHTSTEYPGDHRVALTCTASGCHSTNTDAAVWRTPSLRGSCAGCHSGNFKAGSHPKVSGVSNYTASELRNCSGACHTYTNATLTTISKTRNGPQHRVTSNGF